MEFKCQPHGLELQKVNVLHIQMALVWNLCSSNKLPLLALPENKGYTISDQFWYSNSFVLFFFFFSSQV